LSSPDWALDARRDGKKSEIFKRVNFSDSEIFLKF
jgi:hypothetical protein